MSPEWDFRAENSARKRIRKPRDCIYANARMSALSESVWVDTRLPAGQAVQDFRGRAQYPVTGHLG